MRSYPTHYSILVLYNIILRLYARNTRELHRDIRAVYLQSSTKDKRKNPTLWLLCPYFSLRQDIINRIFNVFSLSNDSSLKVECRSHDVVVIRKSHPVVVAKRSSGINRCQRRKEINLVPTIFLFPFFV